MAHTLSENLFPQTFQALTRHHISAAQNHRTAAGSWNALTQAKTRAPVNPVPALRLFTGRTAFGALAPLVTFAYISSVQLDYQREGLLLQARPHWLQLLRRPCRRAHLLIEPLAFFRRQFSLPPRLSIQSRAA